MQARRSIAAELRRAATRGALFLDPRSYPALAELMCAGEYYATWRPARRVFHHRGTRYRWHSTVLGRLVISSIDGEALVASGPSLLWGREYLDGGPTRVATGAE